ncbi:MAG: SurA N-terminal domain-containing protein [Sulfuricella sp.]|nr:SurA N-terminal domain-containing protein [Sulfuricella sp.]
MLEVIRERAQGLIVKIILALITIPFALWGVDSYIRHGDKADVVAKVDGQQITRPEFDRTLKEQQGQMRAMMGAKFDPTLLDRPEVRQSVLDGLVQQRLLAAEADRVGFNMPDLLLAAIIADIPEFQQDGKFSQALYEKMVGAQDMTPTVFEARLRQNLLIQQLREGLVYGLNMPRTIEDTVARLAEQKREISQAMLLPEQFMAQIRINPADVRAYYDTHKEEFRIPEQVRLDYVALSVSDLAPQMAVSDEEVRKYYDEHRAQYQEPEQRRASHILIGVAAGAGAAEKAAARAKAEQILKEIGQSPVKFEDLARKNSQDPGSAAKGGDLGFFPRGAMVKPFEDAAFALKGGEISGLVQSDFGFHIIKLTAIRHGGNRELNEARGEIEQELKKQKAAQKFAELAETFSNIVYEQSDSLKPAAEALKLKIQSSPWIGKNGTDVAPLLNNPKLLQAAFSDEALKLKRNTEAVEVAPNTLVAARVAEYKAASYRPFEELNVELSKRMLREQADALAVKQGKDALAALQKGGAAAGLRWGAPIMITRQDASSLGRDVLNQIFRADVGKLPAYVGIENPKGGYLLIRVSNVVAADAIDPAKMKLYAGQMSQALMQEYSSAYLASLKQKADISVAKEKLGKAEHQ